VKKLCGKKRNLDAIFDDWDDFEAQLRAWNCPTQSESLELNCTFNLDRVPVNFTSELPRREDGSYDRTPLNNAVGQLAKIIWEVGGFRFKLRRTHWDRLKFIYVCCQDNSHAVDSVAKGKQDHPRMERFECHSQLVFKPSLAQRTLEITMCHRHHTSYVDLHLSSDVVAFIQERTASSTPAEIYRE
ncbi:hypothetical protein V8E54_007735, partial [Elaphomyces granulatus]